ncbi:MAG: Uma2 family endonuclease, partial [Prochlorothrix sp.]
MLITDQQPKHLPLPEPEELICSDDTPVDNEDQNLLPNLLLTTLLRIWADRFDWFFGVDMGIFHTTGDDPRVPIVPDGFLSLGVDRRKAEQSRRSYIIWKEEGVVPSFVLEMMSFTARDEYGKKLEVYRKLGVLYCAIYNPQFWQRDQHEPFEVYRLEKGQYVRQLGEPVWMPEIGLGLGRYQYAYMGLEQELLAWFDESGEVYDPPEVTRKELLQEQRRTERQRLLAQQERERADRAEAQLQQEQHRTEQARQRAEQEQQRAEQERQRAEQEQQRAEQERQLKGQERQRAEQAEAQLQEERQLREQERQQSQQILNYLRSLGMDPDNL